MAARLGAPPVLSPPRLPPLPRTPFSPDMGAAAADPTPRALFPFPRDPTHLTDDLIFLLHHPSRPRLVMGPLWAVKGSAPTKGRSPPRANPCLLHRLRPPGRRPVVGPPAAQERRRASAVRCGEPLPRVLQSGARTSLRRARRAPASHLSHLARPSRPPSLTASPPRPSPARPSTGHHRRPPPQRRRRTPRAEAAQAAAAPAFGGGCHFLGILLPAGTHRSAHPPPSFPPTAMEGTPRSVIGSHRLRSHYMGAGTALFPIPFTLPCPPALPPDRLAHHSSPHRMHAYGGQFPRTDAGGQRRDVPHHMAAAPTAGAAHAPPTHPHSQTLAHSAEHPPGRCRLLATAQKGEVLLPSHGAVARGRSPHARRALGTRCAGWDPAHVCAAFTKLTYVHELTHPAAGPASLGV